MTKDWESRKEEIRKLYILEKKPLTEVMRIIEGKHRFIASPRAYRDQLKKWGYMKNRTQAFPKPKQRARASNHSGQRPAPSLPNQEVHEMLQGGVSFPGSLSAFSALPTSHNHLDFPTPNLSSAGVPETRLNGLNQDTEVSGLFQFEQNAQDDQGRTQLHRAALDKDIEQVRLLLHAGDAVGIQDHAGNIPLHSGVVARSIDIVRLLLRFGSAVNAKNHQGHAPLHLAISQPDLVTALTDYGADASIQDAEGDTPLHLVLSIEPSQESSTNYSTVEILLKSGADPNKENNTEVTPFLKLLDRPYSQEKVLSAIRSFLEAGGSTRKSLPDGRTPLQIFLSRSQDNGFGIKGLENRLENSILRHFIAKEASVITPVSSGEPLILKYCQRVLQSWDLDYALGQQLFRRITPDQVKKVGNSLLLKLVADWHWQRKGGVVELVQRLLELGANPNHEDLQGQTALILLLQHSILLVDIEDMVMLLLEHGADPWHRDYHGKRAILLAVERYPEKRIYHMMLEADLQRRRSAHALTLETEGCGPNESEPWHGWQEAVLAADWSESKQLMLRESRDVSTEVDKRLREGALAVLAENHIRLMKEKPQGESTETELRRKHVAGIIRDCREREITLDASCTDYLVELCL